MSTRDDEDYVAPWWAQTPDWFEPPSPSVPGLAYAQQIARKFYDVPTQAMMARMSGHSTLADLALALNDALNPKKATPSPPYNPLRRKYPVPLHKR